MSSASMQRARSIRANSTWARSSPSRSSWSSTRSSITRAESPFTAAPSRTCYSKISLALPCGFGILTRSQYWSFARMAFEPVSATDDLGFDPAALKRKYLAERDKRLRADGNEQYVEIAGRFGGLLAGARLREAGIDDIRIVEKGGDFGGTWYWNRYPGAACDIESYVYLPLLEELNFIPVEKYTRAPEILAHCRSIGEKFDLYRGALFQTEVTALVWDDALSSWIVRTTKGDALKARFVV